MDKIDDNIQFREYKYFAYFNIFIFFFRYWEIFK